MEADSLDGIKALDTSALDGEIKVAAVLVGGTS